MGVQCCLRVYRLLWRECVWNSMGVQGLIGQGWRAQRAYPVCVCGVLYELCRSSTFETSKTEHESCVPSVLSSVELLQSSNIPDTTARQGSRFTPTLPCQVFLPFRGRDRSTWRQCLLMRYRNRSHDLVAVSVSSVYCAAMFRVIGMCRARLLCNPSSVVRKNSPVERCTAVYRPDWLPGRSRR